MLTICSVAGDNIDPDECFFLDAILKQEVEKQKRA